MATKKPTASTKKAPSKKTTSSKTASSKRAASKPVSSTTKAKTTNSKAVEPIEIEVGGGGDGALVLVTGATGFLGGHIIEALQRSGYRVRALCRSADAELSNRGVDVVRGDVTDRKSLAKAMEGGVTYVIHAAGAVTRGEGSEGRAWMMKVHVAGTRFVVDAACEAGVSRVVHVSTSGTIAVGTDPEMVFHEDDETPLSIIHRWPYYLSKFLGERAASDAIRLAPSTSTTELVTVNPSLALGPGDKRGSSTHDVQRFLKRQIPVVPSGGLAFVDVRDIASAVVSALVKGKPSHRYLLSALNCTCEDFFERISEVSGVAGPMIPVKLPRRLTTLGVGLLEKAAALVGAVSPVSKTEADMAAHFWYVDSRKAEEELGFAPRPPMETLLDTVRDIRAMS